MTDPHAAAPRLEEERLAGIHLRTGALALARSELEALASRGAVSAIGYAVLAEARWRGGDLEHAAEAAAAHQAAGGDLPIAAVILAEAAAAAGRPEDAASQIGRVGAKVADDLDGIFAGMPRRAAWPTATDRNGAVAGMAVDQPGSDAAGAGPNSSPNVVEAASGSRRRTPASAPADAFPDPADLVGQARDDMRSGDPERMIAAFSRLALALRLDATQAAAIADLLARRAEAAAQLVRGDALRIAGRAVESEAAYAAAAKALAAKVRRPS